MNIETPRTIRYEPVMADETIIRPSNVLIFYQLLLVLVSRETLVDVRFFLRQYMETMSNIIESDTHVHQKAA